MPDPQNEVTCPECGEIHYRYPRRLCRSCQEDEDAMRFDHWRAERKDEGGRA